MIEQLSAVLNQYAAAFHPHIPRYRQNRYVQIVVLRETRSHAIFTTEGQTLDVERLQAGITNTNLIDRVVMYKRKQVAPERRMGKALLRDLDILSKTPRIKGGKVAPADCQIMGNSCGQCPDCILYGFAATTGNASQRARILTDSGFVVRTTLQVMRDIKLNAIAETTAGGIAGSAYAHRENVLPQVFIPTVETLLDVTAAEFVYVLGNILRTSRYGAESNREGVIRNHILGIYFSDVELFSNLELTQRYFDALADEHGKVPEYLTLDQFKDRWLAIEAASLAGVVGRRQRLADLDGLLEGMGALYEDTAALRSFLKALDDATLNYVKTVKAKEKVADSGESDTEE
jgi:CRISPR-associated protein Csc2